MSVIDAKLHKEFSYKDMQLRPLFFLQEKLDEKINGRLHGDEELIVDAQRKKQLAFRVEMGELLNELNLHKYWSNKLPGAKDKILEEWADGFHFLLSMGGDKQIKDYEYQGIFDGELSAEDLIFIFDRLMTMPWLELKKDDFFYGLEMYLKLGYLLLFSWTEMKEAYVKKNLENHKRQEEGY